jgi:hypothetical protein
MAAREYPAPFMKKDSFKSMRDGFKEASRAELQPIDEDELQRKGQTMSEIRHIDNLQ